MLSEEANMEVLNFKSAAQRWIDELKFCIVSSATDWLLLSMNWIDDSGDNSAHGVSGISLNLFTRKTRSLI
jgi:hypothetical protein